MPDPGQQPPKQGVHYTDSEAGPQKTRCTGQGVRMTSQLCAPMVTSHRGLDELVLPSRPTPVLPAIRSPGPTEGHSGLPWDLLREASSVSAMKWLFISVWLYFTPQQFLWPKTHGVCLPLTGL